MRSHIILLRSLAAGSLIACTSCKPLGGADPLYIVQGSASALPPLVSDADRLQDQRFHAENQERAAESSEGNSFRGSVGATTRVDF